MPRPERSLATQEDGWTYTAEPNFSGEVLLTYVVTDPDGASTPFSYRINITAVNDAPTATFYHSSSNFGRQC